jgi:phage host-nuclease inhibitor protein Gam
MEALNISQLPRWKQDEIVIDGLSRRVQQLEADLNEMQKIHREEMLELANERDALREANRQLERALGKAERKIERLRTRKAELKSGAALLNSQKEVLLFQKAALQDELLETRAERDGYLSDRGALGTVLGQVRKMRERLLEAHRGTESSLTEDAHKLKGVIEGAISDIDELHAEVARKKALSVHNEKTADDFRDRISAKLRAVIQSVIDFRSGQDENHGGLKSAMTDIRSVRQQATASLKADVTKMGKMVEGVLHNLSQQARELESARKGRVSQGQETATAHLKQLQDALDKTQRAVQQRLSELASGADFLGSNLETWAGKVKVHCEESAATSSRFAQEMATKVAALEAHLASASQAQLAHLASHRDALSSYVKTEKTTLEEQSTRMIADISGFVQRLLQDHSGQAQRRVEAAVAGFTAATEAAEGQVRDLTTHQKTAFAVVGSETAAHNTAVCKAHGDAEASSAAQLSAVQGLLAQVRASGQESGSELDAGATRTRAQGQEQHERRMQTLREESSAAEATTATLEAILAKAREDTAADANALRKKADADLQRFGEQAADMDGRLSTTHDGVRNYAGEAHDDLFDTEAEAVQYVDKEIKRDTQTPPPHKEYVYPEEYAATDAYGSILSDIPEVWQREDGINKGAIVPGKGPDFPGEPGPDDESGLLTSTKEQPHSPEEQHQLDRAMYQSEAGEYSDPEGFVDPLDRVDEDEEDEEEGDEDEAAVATDGMANGSDEMEEGNV